MISLVELSKSKQLLYSPKVATEAPLRDKSDIKKELCQPNERVLKNIKWMFSIYKKNWDKLKFQEQLNGLIRGQLAESFDLQDTVNLSGRNTVYSTVDANTLSKMQGISREQALRYQGKADIITAAIHDGLLNHPLRIRQEDLTIKNSNRTSSTTTPAAIAYKMMLGYGNDKSKGNNKEPEIPAGIFTGDTTSPDAIVTCPDGETGTTEIKGFVEIKAYTTYEFSQMLQGLRETKQITTIVMSEQGQEMTLGASLNKERNFINTVRRIKFDQEDLYLDTVVVMRFPNDIPDEQLQEYGQLVHEYGYTNVVIQKRALSSEELTAMAELFIKNNQPLIEKDMKGLQFSDKEISAIQELAT